MANVFQLGIDKSPHLPAGGKYPREGAERAPIIHPPAQDRRVFREGVGIKTSFCGVLYDNHL